MTKYFLFLAFFIAVIHSNAMDSDTLIFEEKLPLHIGLIIGGNYNIYNANITDLDGMPQQLFEDKLLFENGDGFGFNLGAIFHIELTDKFRLSAIVNYTTLNGIMTRSENVPFSIHDNENISYIDGTYTQELNSNLQSLNLNIIPSYKFFDEFYFGLGINTGYLLSSEYTFSEEINADELTYPDGSTKQEYTPEIEAATLLFGIEPVLSYRYIFGDSDEFVIEPRVSFNFNFNDALSNEDMQISLIKLAASFEYKLTKEISEFEKIKEIEHHEFKKITNASLAKILQNYNTFPNKIDSIENVESLIDFHLDSLNSYPNSEFNLKRISETVSLAKYSNSLKDSLQTLVEFEKESNLLQSEIDEIAEGINEFENSKEPLDSLSLNSILSYENELTIKKNYISKSDNNLLNSLITPISLLVAKIENLKNKAKDDIQYRKNLLALKQEKDKYHLEIIDKHQKRYEDIAESFEEKNQDSIIAEIKISKDELTNYRVSLQNQDGFDNEKKSFAVSDLLDRFILLEEEIKGYVKPLPKFDITEILKIPGDYVVNSFAFTENLGSTDRESKILFMAGSFRDSVYFNMEIKYENLFEINNTLISNFQVTDEYTIATGTRFFSELNNEATNLKLYSNKKRNAMVSGNFQDSLRLDRFGTKKLLTKDKGIFIVDLKGYNLNGYQLDCNGDCGTNALDLQYQINRENEIEGVFLAGSYDNQIDLQIGHSPTDETTLRSKEGENLFLVKYEYGTPLNYVNHFPDTKQGMYAKGIPNDVLATSYSVYMVGYLNGRSVFGDILTEDSKDLNPDSEKNGFIAQFDQEYLDFNGAILFKGGNSEIDRIIVSEDESEFYIIGSFSDSLEIGEKKIIAKGKQDMFIARMDLDDLKDVEAKWLTSIGGSGEVQASDIKIVSSQKNNEPIDKIFISGNYSEKIYSKENNYDFETKGKLDFFVAALDYENGLVSKIESFGSEGNDICNKMHVNSDFSKSDVDDILYLIGYTQGGIQFNRNEIKLNEEYAKKVPYTFLISVK